MVEVDDYNHGPKRPGYFDTSEKKRGQRAVSAENGLVSLAAEEGVPLTTDLHVTGEGIQFEIGEKYSLNFRGSYLYWWKWGTLEEPRGVTKGDEEQDETVPRMTIPASNLVEITVQK